jgi:adenine/guanine phosphoribosyltransferase-like PRPP-binding protein
MSEPLKQRQIDAVVSVVSIEIRGLIYGAGIALYLKKPPVPLFKGGKIKRREHVVESFHYRDYSGEEKFLEMFKGSLEPYNAVALVDDWFATGNTGRAAIELITPRKLAGVSIAFNELSRDQEAFFQQYGLYALFRITLKIK